MHYAEYSERKIGSQFEGDGSSSIHEHLGLEALKLLDKSSLKSRPDDWAPGAVRDASGQKVYASWAVEILDGGHYTVRPGDSLWLIARRALGVTGHAGATNPDIAREVKRLVELNKKECPELVHHSERLQAGTILRIRAKDETLSERSAALSRGPEPAAAQPQAAEAERLSERQLRSTSGNGSNSERPAEAKVDLPLPVSPGDASPAVAGSSCPARERVEVHGGLVYADKCDKFEIGQDGVAIVRPGADVVVNRGGRVFAFGGKVTALAGSRVLFAGGDLDAQPESQVKYIPSPQSELLSQAQTRAQTEAKTDAKTGNKAVSEENTVKFLPNLEI